VYQKRVRDVDDLKKRLVEVCPKSDRISTSDAVSNHRSRFLGLLGGHRSGDYEFCCGLASWRRYIKVISIKNT